MALMNSMKAATSLVTMSKDEPEVETNNGGLFASMKAATSLVTLQKNEVEVPENSWTKTTVLKYQNTNISDQKELQRLNLQLKNYLENVRVLEDLNKSLIVEVERARTRSMPQLMDKSKLDEQLDAVRLRLEDESTDCVIHQARLEEVQGLSAHLSSRIKFYHNEGEIQKQKIITLQNQLAELKNSREYIIRSAELANENIEREKGRIFQSEKDLEGMRSKLRTSKSKNKQIEFEMQTLLDEIEFRKAVFQEECAEIRTRQQNGRVLEGVDLSNFYRNELVTAVRQIREDFHNLSDHQLAEYKESMEAKLKYQLHQAHLDKMNAENVKNRLDSKMNLELQTSSELRAYSEQFGGMMAELQSENSRLNSRLTQLQNGLSDLKSRNANYLEAKTSELETLRQQIEFYKQELAAWDSVHRSKLESEIQTYRSILNTQLRMMKTDSYVSYEVVNRRSPSPPPQIVYKEVIRERSPPPRPQIVYKEPEIVTREVVRVRTPSPVVTREVIRVRTPSPVVYQTRERSASRDHRSSSSKVFDTQVKRDSKQNETIESGRTRYETINIDRRPSRQYETVRVTRFNYVDVIRRYQTGDESKDKMLTVLQDVFQYADKDQSGTINAREMDSILKKLNVNISRSQLEKMMRDADLNMTGDIGFDEFIRLMMPVFTGKVDDEDLWYAFKKFDLDNSGYISTKELQQILARIGQHYSLDQIAELVEMVDVSRDGQLSFQDFVRLMKLPASSFENLGKRKVITVKETTLTEEERRRNDAVNVLRQVFQHFDSDNSGSINAREMDKVLLRLNVNLSKSQLEKLLRDADLNFSSDIGFNEFLRMMLPVFTGNFDDDSLYFAFKKFDTNNTGYITANELKQVLSKIGQNYSEKQIDEMIRTVDRDGDGRLSFQEFKQLLKSPSSR